MIAEKKIPKGYKNSTLGVIPEDWEVKKLNDIFLSGRLGGNYENSESHFGIPVIKMGNIGRGKVIIEKVQYLPQDSKYDEVDILAKGDLLFNTRNTMDLVGKVAIWRNELPLAIYNSNLMRLEFKIEFVGSNEFMNYAFNSSYGINQLKGIATGTTSVAAIYGRDLKNVKFILPNKNEQKAIADCLSTWDKAIEKLNQLIAQKELRKKGLMQELLTGKKRLRGFDGEWQEFKLSYFIEEYREKPKKDFDYEILTSAKTGLMKQSEYYGNSRITNREDVDYNIIPPNYLTYRSRSDDGLFTINKNDLNVIGLISGYYPVFTVKNGNLDFILLYCNFYKEKLTKYSIGTSQLVLSINALKTANFKLPSLEEQNSIALILLSIDSEIKLLKNKLEQLKKQKKGLMQVLLTGKKRLRY